MTLVTEPAAPGAPPSDAESGGGDAGIMVGVQAHLVASGGAGEAIKLTLLLSPAAPNGGRSVDLANWPEAIVKLIARQNLTVFLQPASGEAASRPRAGAANQVSVPVSANGFQSAMLGAGTAGNLDAVKALWTACFTAAPGNPDCYGDGFSALWSALQDWSGERSGHPAAAGSPPDSTILSLQQGDLALGLELMRAWELAASLSGLAGGKQNRDTLEQALAAAAQQPAGYDNATAAGIAQARALLAGPTGDGGQPAAAIGTAASAAARAACAGNGVAAPGPIALSTSRTAATLIAHTPVQLQTDMATPLASHVVANTPGPPDNTPAAAGGDGQGVAAQISAEQAVAAQQAIAAQNALRDMVTRRFYALQSAPVLSRLFGLTIDLDVNWKDFEGFFLGAPSKGAKPPGGFVFLAVQIGLSNSLSPATLWTLAKYVPRDPARGVADAGFWPATRAELDHAPCGPSLLTQQNGFLVTSAGWAADPDSRAPRYELSTLDVRNAAESQIHRNRERSIQNTPPAPPGAPMPMAPLVHAVQRQTFTTGGLTVIDRGRQAVIGAALGARTGHATNAAADGPVLLDADDLMVGFRLDVGVPDGLGHQVAYQWRSMMNRNVAYGTSGRQQAAIQRLTAKLAGKPGTPERIPLDATMIAPPVRMLSDDAAKQPDDPARQQDAIAEEITALWDGGPMAMDCSGSAVIKKVDADLPWGTSISLPSDAKHDLRPPLLRFGKGYRIGLRAVYQGGGSPGAGEAKAIYDGPGQASFAFPPSSDDKIATPLRRFLRHERLNPPILLLPETIALRQNGVMGYERGPQAVVRCVFPGPGDRKSDPPRDNPKCTSRIFVPDNVAPAFAALHGVFDHESGETPKGALPGIRHDAAQGGFPFVSAQTHAGLDNEPYSDPPHVNTGAAANSDAVFANASLDQAKASKPYYPDPMARFYRLGLRFANTQSYLLGGALNVACYAGEGPSPYANFLPLLVTIERVKARSGGPTLQVTDVLMAQGATTMQPSPGGAAVPVTHVRVLLAPGEEFDLDVWNAPGPQWLARNFGLVETLAVLCKYRQDDGPGSFSDLLGPLAATMQSPGASRFAGFIGIGGLTTPSPNQLQALARRIDSAMLQAQVDELAAARTLRVTHAVNRPVEVPVLIDTAPVACAPAATAPAPVMPPADSANIELRALRIARLDPATSNLLRLTEAKARYGQFFDQNGQAVICPDASDYSLGGSLMIDLNTSDSFEIVALTAVPRSAKFDDRNRGRSQRNLRAGIWPDEINARALHMTTQLDVPRTLVATRDVYGFDVAADGTVTLPRAPVTLLRVDHLPTPQAADALDQLGGLEVIQLEQLYGLFSSATNYQASNQPNAAQGTRLPKRLMQAKLSLLHNFPDGKARRLDLHAVSISRFAHAMIIPPERDPATGMFMSSTPLLPQQQSRASAVVSVWLPATQRPAKPEIRSPIPVFDYDVLAASKMPSRTLRYTKSRRSMTRLQLKREWFSSGEGELLGIVIWPPNLFEACTGDVGAGIVEIDKYSGPLNGPAEKVPRRIDIPDFVDDDLGPGGAFVTRWGYDPIRMYDPKDSPAVLMPAQAFADSDVVPRRAGRQCGADNGGGRHVPHVLMPVADNAASDQTALGNAAQPDPSANGQPQTLAVALLTYVPRFDVNNEQWYVDVDIDSLGKADMFVRFGLVRYQPNAPDALQLSYPVVTWAQLLPPRKVVVDVQANATDKTVIDQITVTVSGPASLGLADVPFLAKKYERPMVKFELWFSTLDTNGAKSEFLIAPVQTNDTKQTTEITNWVATFKGVKRPDAGGKLFVFVEELECRRPASYDNEPVDLSDKSPLNKVFIESGPRFEMRVDL